jgi:hypothetical protein
MDPPRTPFPVHCVACGHTWPGAWLPLSLNKLSALLRRLQCPWCGAAADHIIADHIVAGATLTPAREARLVEIKKIGEGGG